MPRIRDYNYARWAQHSFNLIQTDQPTVVAVDTETPGVNFYDAPFCVTLSWRSGSRIRNAYFELGGIDFAEELVRQILADLIDRGGLMVFHNAKFDLQKLILGGMLKREQLDPYRIEDTEGIFHLLYPNDPKKLKTLAVKHLRTGTIMVPYASGKKKGELHEVMREDYELDKIRRKMGLKRDDGYEVLPREYLVPYAMKDTEYTLRLYELGRPKLEGGLLDCYKMEQELCLALLDMEAPGIKLDMEYLPKIRSEFGVKKLTEWQATLDLAEMPDLNLNAPHQILAAFEKRGVKLEDTQAATLRKVKDPLAKQILTYRNVEGLYDKLSELLSEQRDGIAHPHIRQHGAKTGRSSSSAARPDG